MSDNVISHGPVSEINLLRTVLEIGSAIMIGYDVDDDPVLALSNTDIDCEEWSSVDVRTLQYRKFSDTLNFAVRV